MFEEFCEWDTFSPQCAPDEVVLIREARYGRMHHGTCIQDDRDIGCERDVTGLVHRKCSGRRACQIKVPDQELESTQRCGEMKNFLQVKNACVKGK